ncbi:MAG TPA: hypothetical protein VJM31_02555 [Vicinamibacterales bacterium]|nr:hypothetical protein [Vicinamibacterales bacterium]
MVIKKVLRQFIRDDGGQDLVEYALLTVFVALVGALAFPFLQDSIRDGYISWDDAEQDLWEPRNP